MNSIPSIALAEAPVLLLGESGTGKELLAQNIHRLSRQSKKPFVALNCAAIPDNLLESELFGHLKGSFTGASYEKKGLFESVQGGTIFLDEIGDMPLALQAKILRVLQEKKIKPVGANSERLVDFRLICATHKNLRQAVQQGYFREDLFYRIHVLPIHLPPLRERVDDIPELVLKLSQTLAEKYHRAPVKLSDRSLQILKDRRWEGNVRELENYLERLLVLHPNSCEIDVTQLPDFDDNVGTVPLVESFQTLPTLSELVDAYVTHVFKKVEYHQGKAAKILGVSRRTLSRKYSHKI